MDPKALYVTPRQTELWRQVFLKHSPIQGNPEFIRIYGEAFRRLLELFSAESVLLVGLGCGTGAKEAELYANLKKMGRTGIFSAIDVSEELVIESVRKLESAGAVHRRSLVCDLAQATSLSEWLEQEDRDLPRVMTFFGLVPNLSPTVVRELFRSVLRPGDVLLVSAHLVPVKEDNPEELAAAMELVLPQYDNAETLAWLNAGLEYWGLQERIDYPEMKIGQVEGVPAFMAEARWKREEPFEQWGHRFTPDTTKLFRVFHSLRYTPSLFEETLHRGGFDYERLAMTSCRQEAIWSVRRGAGAMFQPPPT